MSRVFYSNPKGPDFDRPKSAVHYEVKTQPLPLRSLNGMYLHHNKLWIKTIIEISQLTVFFGFF